MNTPVRTADELVVDLIEKYCHQLRMTRDETKQNHLVEMITTLRISLTPCKCHQKKISTEEILARR